MELNSNTNNYRERNGWKINTVSVVSGRKYIMGVNDIVDKVSLCGQSRTKIFQGNNKLALYFQISSIKQPYFKFKST